MIILYNPWSTRSVKHPLPMSLLAVASTLEGRYDYEIVDGNLERDPVGKIVELAGRRRPAAIGITVMPGPQLERAVPHSRQLKRALPGVPIVWGGYFPSQHYATVLKDDAVDVCVRGQGEVTFPELVRVLSEGGDLGSVAGISYRRGRAAAGGEVITNPNRPLVELDELPEWPYHRLPMEHYFHRHYLGRRVATHQSSYGCPFACNFCAIVPIVERRWVAQSPARLAAVIEHQHRRYGADAVQFHDMDFFIKERRVEEFCDRITPLGMTWWALGRIDELMRYKDSTWRRMKASGLKMIFCGAEAGSEEVLARMNKGGKVSPDLTLELAKRMKEWDVVPEFSFVLGNPPDPWADVEQTLRFIRRLKAVNPATELILYMYTPVPKDGTLYEEARALGFKFPDTLDQWISGDWKDFSLRRDPRQNPWLNPALKRRVRDFERVLNAYYPTTTDLTLRGLKRAVLRTLGAWRYRLQFYHHPLELRLFHRLFHYQRPETSGF
ncbi:MAG: radical SAM protein [Acidobacteria bacterium]|nr:MAG: radical SAM protein [Acidobacteriota bacterium]